MSACDPRLIELERADAARMALEAGAQKIETFNTNEKYQFAMRLAAKILREFAGTIVPETGNDIREAGDQIEHGR